MSQPTTPSTPPASASASASAAQPRSASWSAPWPDGTATGVGSLPGVDPRTATQLVVDQLPDLPHLPELPQRGPGADMIGRTLGLLRYLPAQWGPSGWAFTDRPGGDMRRAVSYLGQDLDVLEEQLTGWDGPVKVQVCGPWTLAATVELRSGRRALADPGAVRDLRQALAEAVAGHLADLRRRLPAAALLLQLDEPALVAVVRGSVPTPSGLATIGAVDEVDAESGLSEVLAALPEQVPAVVHCCASSPPVASLVRAGFAAVSLDAAVLTSADDDPIATAVEAGVGLMLGLVRSDPEPATGPQPGGSPAGGTGRDLAEPARALWRRTGLAVDALARVVVTPSCGLAQVSPGQAATALSACRAAARTLVDDPDPDRG